MNGFIVCVFSVVMLWTVYDSQCVPVQSPGNEKDLPEQAQSGQDTAQANALLHLCKQMCKSQACPPQCTEQFLNPWSRVGRSANRDDLTFDDYLQLLVHDMTLNKIHTH